mmetsp:Transcript_92826/g.194019  ORF Transcript_92826/g.194019 Transcript_92826/m.194019 type:complete len:93 (+) Transcript_92826:153-431(+)
MMSAEAERGQASKSSFDSAIEVQVQIVFDEGVVVGVGVVGEEAEVEVEAENEGLVGMLFQQLSVMRTSRRLEPWLLASHALLLPLHPQAIPL